MSGSKQTNWENYLRYDAAGHVYILKCEPPSLSNIHDYSNICYKMKTSHGYTEIDELKLEHVHPRKWFRIELFVNSERICPLISYIGHIANNVYYVGQTKDIKKRIKAHINGNGGKFTQIMDVVGVVRIESIAHTENLQRILQRREENLGLAYNNLHDGLKSDDEQWDIDDISSIAHYDCDSPIFSTEIKDEVYSPAHCNMTISVPKSAADRKNALKKFE